MTTTSLHAEFKNLANTLDNYLRARVPLGRDFADLVKSIRSRIPHESFPSKSDFINDLYETHGALMKRLVTIKQSSPDPYIEEIYDIVTSETDMSAAIKEIDSIARTGNPRDEIKYLLSDLFSYQPRRADRGLSTSDMDGVQERYYRFRSVLEKHVKAQEIQEILAWLDVVAHHPRFKAHEQIAYKHDGDIHVVHTVKNMMRFANSIAISDKPIFNFKDRDGNPKSFASYNLQSRGLPDLMYIQGDSIKVGFASLSRDTSIEGNSFIRHSIESAFYNAVMELHGIEVSDFRRREVIGHARILSQKYKSGSDFVQIGSKAARMNGDDDVLNNVSELLEDLVIKSRITENEANQILAKSKPMLEKNQSTRSLFFVRLNGYLNGKVDFNQIFSPVISENDIEIISPREHGNIKYLTASPAKRLVQFMETAHSEAQPKHEEEKAMLRLLSESDENKLFRGLTRKAFMVAQGNVSGALLIDHKAQKKFLDKISFISDSDDYRTENHLSTALLALMFTKDQYLWKAIEEELSDVSAYSTQVFGEHHYARGIYSDERNNLLTSVRVIIDVCNKELRAGNDINSVIELHFGEYSDYVKEQISTGVIPMMAERFNTETIGFVNYGIRTSLSENLDVMQRLSDSLDVFDSRFEGFSYKQSKTLNSSMKLR